MAAASVVAPAMRELSVTEKNWCTLQKGGTGILVAALWFGRPISKSSVQAAVNELINQLPYLNSQVRSGGKDKLFFELRRDVPTVVEEVNPFITEGEEAGGQEERMETWEKITDLEANKLFPSFENGGCAPIFGVALYKGLPKNSAQVVLRFQSAAFDVPSLGPVVSAFMRNLQQMVEREEKKQNIEEMLRNVTLKDELFTKFTFYPSMEEMIPKGAGDKNMLSKGFDLVNYGLKATAFRYLTFDPKTVKKEQRSCHLRASLSRETTDRLIQACEKNSTDLYGALSSAFLKALADYKRIGKKGEQYAVAVLFNCRSQLSPPLPEEALGFYNSAMLATTQVSENATGASPFWKVAAEVTKSFRAAIKDKKQFKDLKTLNQLMIAAVNFPNMTPEGSLRTATISMLHDPAPLNIPHDAAEYLQLRDHVVFASTHGVGPCVGTYYVLTDGAINLTFCYPSPMFSRAHIQTLVDTSMKYLLESL